MAYLFDSNILLRLVHQNHPDHSLVRAAVSRLRRQGERGHYTSQNLGEFWNVTTRPTSARGGFGCTLAEADRAARVIERLLTYLPDSPAVHAEWRQLLVQHSIQGVQVHDARLAAAMKVYGLTHILTLNERDFARYPEFSAVHPQNV